LQLRSRNSRESRDAVVGMSRADDRVVPDQIAPPRKWEHATDLFGLLVCLLLEGVLLFALGAP
jgi:hypothetical protein